MKPITLCALATALLAEAVASDSTIQQICGGIKDIWGCSKKFDVPVGAKAKMCPNKWFEVRIAAPKSCTLP